MIKKESRNVARVARHERIRSKVSGTSECPRLNIFRSNSNKELKLENGSNVEAAIKVGELLAKRAKDKKITKVTFDRGGYLYHGRVKALADAARENGLEF